MGRTFPLGTNFTPRGEAKNGPLGYPEGFSAAGEETIYEVRSVGRFIFHDCFSPIEMKVSESKKTGTEIF
jgi:hypothetical protein